MAAVCTPNSGTRLSVAAAVRSTAATRVLTLFALYFSFVHCSFFVPALSNIVEMNEKKGHEDSFSPLGMKMANVKNDGPLAGMLKQEGYGQNSGVSSGQVSNNLGNVNIPFNNFGQRPEQAGNWANSNASVIRAYTCSAHNESHHCSDVAVVDTRR